MTTLTSGTPPLRKATDPEVVVHPLAVPDRVLLLLSAATVVDDGLLTALLQIALDEQRRDVVWLALALLRPELPSMVDVNRSWRQLRLDGPAAVLTAEDDRRGLMVSTAEQPPLHERLVHNQVLVDVHHTAHYAHRTGIQRVVLETLRRWAVTQPIRVVGWTEDFAALRDLDQAEHQHVDAGPGPERPSWALVPWQCTFLLPEVVVDLPRLTRLSAMVESGAVRLSALVYDLIPVTAAETAGPAMPGAFAAYLGVLRHATTITPISTAAATEYRGFGMMLAGQGLTGPEVVEVPLPAEAVATDPAGVLAARATLGLGDIPMVLAVGTHEPRKNHLALLHAAELLWREGLDFRLVLLGNNGWGSTEFIARSVALQAAGRPLSLVHRASDDLLWASYHAARVVAFPSIHEGFGLPVAEALTCGTPVVTSNVGSMLQLAVEGGALAVDPHDDHALADALRSVLTDDDLHARLCAEALARTVRSWDVYAAEVWQALTRPAVVDLRS